MQQINMLLSMKSNNVELLHFRQHTHTSFPYYLMRTAYKNCKTFLKLTCPLHLFIHNSRRFNPKQLTNEDLQMKNCTQMGLPKQITSWIQSRNIYQSMQCYYLYTIHFFFSKFVLCFFHLIFLFFSFSFFH